MDGLRRRDWLAGVSGIGMPGMGMQVREAVAARGRMSGTWTAGKLAGVLLGRDAYRPVPVLGDRKAWEGLPEELRAEALERGGKALKTEWKALRATQFLEFQREGNRARFEGARNARRYRLNELVVAECVEGKGRFLDEIVNGVWLICEETWWGLPAHLAAQKRGVGLPDVTEPVIDLFAAETGAQLAWTYYLLGAALDRVSPLVRERIEIEVERRILKPYEEREDFGWMGLKSKSAVNNWNPWINSNCLACLLLLEKRPERRAGLTAKMLRSLDRFLDGYHEDGGCDEGPGYWGRAGASLFDALDLLDGATGGKVQFWDVPLVAEMGRYIYRVHVAGDWFVNFADAAAKPGIPADLVSRYGTKIRDARMEGFGAWFWRREGKGLKGESLGRQVPALFHARELERVEAKEPLVGEAWMPGIGVMVARQKEGAREGLYVAAQAGHNAESHNHNDVGNFVVYKDGEPLLIDVGVETYSAKTFSAKRYEIWTMQSGYHNCPTVNGVMQAPGRQFEAREVEYVRDAGGVELRMELGAAYPKEARIESWKRVVRLDREKGEVVLRDRARLQGEGTVTLNLMLRRKEDVERVKWEGAGLKREVDEVEVTDGRLQAVWGKRLWRVRLVAEKVMGEGEWVVRVG